LSDELPMWHRFGRIALVKESDAIAEHHYLLHTHFNLDLEYNGDSVGSHRRQPVIPRALNMFGADACRSLMSR
jgi:hypothetical protein